MSQDSREQFEASLKQKGYGPVFRSDAPGREDEYENGYFQFGWMMWQAARDWGVVVLPARREPTEWQSYENHHNQMLDKFQVAANAAGVKVVFGGDHG